MGTYETPDEEESYDMNDDVVEVSDESSNDCSQQQENEPPAIRRSARVPKPKSWMDYITFKTSLEPCNRRHLLQMRRRSCWKESKR